MEQIKGDLLKSDCNYICQQVNCQGRMASGIAKSIKEKWPIVYTEYMNWCHYWIDVSFNNGNSPSGSELMHGRIQIVNVNDDQNVINMAAQLYYGYDGKRYTSYDAFWSCLGEILRTVPEGSSIGFPKGIGCGLGGANWEVIETMIYEVLDNRFKVYIYELEK